MTAHTVLLCVSKMWNLTATLLECLKVSHIRVAWLMVLECNGLQRNSDSAMVYQDNNTILLEVGNRLPHIVAKCDVKQLARLWVLQG